MFNLCVYYLVGKRRKSQRSSFLLVLSLFMCKSLSFGLKSDPRINLFSLYFTTEASHFTHLIEKLSIFLLKLFYRGFFQETVRTAGKTAKKLAKEGKRRN